MFQQTLRFDPNNSRIGNALALAYAKDKLFKESEDEFRKVLDYDPLNTRARIGLGKALCDQGKFLDGIAEYDKVEGAAGKLKELLSNNQKLTYKILVDKYLKMLSLNPEDPQTLYSLGVIYSKMQQHTLAIEQYKKAVSLRPDFTNALFNLASSLEARGEMDSSRGYYQQFLSLPGEKEPLLVSYAQNHLKLIDEKSNGTVRK